MRENLPEGASLPPLPPSYGIDNAGERFRLLVQSVRDYGIFTLDPEGHVTSWNEGAERIKGYRAEEILGHHFSEFYQEEDLARDKPGYELKVATAEGRFEDEGWRVRKDGSLFWANVVITALRDEQGVLVGFAKVTRDLTERRAAEDRAIEDARRLAAEEAARRGAEEHALELGSLLERLRLQKIELEQQTEEAQVIGEELEETNEELQRTNVAMLAGAERASRLLSLAAGLADTRTSDEVADVIFRETTAAVGADAATLALLVEPDDPTSEPSEFVIVRSTGYGAALTERFRRFPVRAGRPLSDAVLSQQPVLIESAAEFRALYPEMAAQIPELEYEAMANVPIMEHERALAGITFSFATARRFDEATRTFLATVGEQCGLALGRARAFEAERRARESSSFLAEASGLLASSLDYEQTLRSLAKAMVPRFADWCTIDMLVEPTTHAWPPRVERLAVAHQDPAKVAWAEAMATHHLEDWSATTGIARVLRDRVSEFYPHVDDEMLVAAAQTPEELALRREIGPSAVIIVPLVARGLVLGALTLAMSESGRRYDVADLALARQIAERAAVAVDNARLFREAARARAVAEEANRAKMDFLATMSHELRTPLNAIAGYTQLLDLGVHGPINEEQRTDLARIRDSGHHLLGLINDVLNYAKLEAGKVEITLQDVRLEPLVESVVSLVTPQAGAKGLRLSVAERGDSATAAGEPGPIARADTEKVRQVLLNVLSNAIKYTARGGSITLAVENGEKVAMVHVRDTGIGIPSDKLERVFEPFVQLGRSLTSRDEGTGLGLAISRDLARAMGGDLVAESEEGVGSTFTLVLPRD